MKIAEAWGLYLLIIIATYLIISVINSNSNKFNTTIKILFSLLAGAVVVFLITPSIITITATDRAWFAFLILVAYLGAIGFGLYIYAINGLKLDNIEAKCTVNTTYSQDAGGHWYISSIQESCIRPPLKSSLTPAPAPTPASAPSSASASAFAPTPAPAPAPASAFAPLMNLSSLPTPVTS